MEILTLAQLRQNPSAALRAVEHDGAEYLITNHRRPVARLVPLAAATFSSLEQNRAFNRGGSADADWADELQAQRDADRARDPWEES